MYVSSTIIPHPYPFLYLFLGFCVCISHNTQLLECSTTYLEAHFVLIFRDLLRLKSNYKSRSKGGVMRVGSEENHQGPAWKVSTVFLVNAGLIPPDREERLLLVAKKVHQYLGTPCPQLYQDLPTHPHSNF